MFRKGDGFEDGTYVTAIHPGDNVRFGQPGGGEDDDEILGVGDELFANGENWEVLVIGGDYVKLGVPVEDEEEAQSSAREKGVGEQDDEPEVAPEPEPEGEPAKTERTISDAQKKTLDEVAKELADAMPELADVVLQLSSAIEKLKDLPEERSRADALQGELEGVFKDYRMFKADLADLADFGGL